MRQAPVPVTNMLYTHPTSTSSSHNITPLHKGQTRLSHIYPTCIICANKVRTTKKKSQQLHAGSQLICTTPPTAWSLEGLLGEQYKAGTATCAPVPLWWSVQRSRSNEWQLYAQLHWLTGGSDGCQVKVCCIVPSSMYETTTGSTVTVVRLVVCV